MVVNIQSLGIDRLSIQERLQLIEEIWDSLPDIHQQSIPENHREELDHRLADADANPDARSTWEEVQLRLRGKS